MVKIILSDGTVILTSTATVVACCGEANIVQIECDEHRVVAFVSEPRLFRTVDVNHRQLKLTACNCHPATGQTLLNEGC
jgi:hypothetical protein